MDNKGRELETSPEFAVLKRNIEALSEHRDRTRRARDTPTLVADRVTAFAGSMLSVYVHLALVGFWLLVNTRVISWVPVFDPYPFVMLAMFASVEAIFLSTFVLISQNRQAELAERRNSLDLQINLLAEHEITQGIRMLNAILQRIGAGEQEATSPLKSEVDPQAVLDLIEHADSGRAEGGSAKGILSGASEPSRP